MRASGPKQEMSIGIVGRFLPTFGKLLSSKFKTSSTGTSIWRVFSINWTSRHRSSTESSRNKGDVSLTEWPHQGIFNICTREATSSKRERVFNQGTRYDDDRVNFGTPKRAVDYKE